MVDCAATTPELIKQFASEDDPADRRPRIGKGSKMNPFDPCDPLEQDGTNKKGQNQSARDGNSAGNNNFLDSKSGLK